MEGRQGFVRMLSVTVLVELKIGLALLNVRLTGVAVIGALALMVRAKEPVTIRIVAGLLRLLKVLAV